MSTPVHISIAHAGDSLVVIDANRRLYVGLSRDGAYYHAVHPAASDLVSAEGATVRREGELTCTCAGGTFRGTCYRTAEAERLEAARADAPAGAGETVEAYRG